MPPMLDAACRKGQHSHKITQPGGFDFGLVGLGVLLGFPMDCIVSKALSGFHFLDYPRVL